MPKSSSQGSLKKYYLAKLMDNNTDALSEGGESDSDSLAARSIGRGMPERRRLLAALAMLNTIEEHLKDMTTDHSRDVMIPLISLRADLFDLVAASAVLDATQSWHFRSLYAWLGHFLQHYILYVTVFELRVYPWLMRRGAIPPAVHAAHDSVRDACDALRAAAADAATDAFAARPLPEREAAVAHMRQIITDINSKLREGLGENQQTVVTLIDAHFTSKEYAAFAVRYWDAWGSGGVYDTDVTASPMHPTAHLTSPGGGSSSGTLRVRGMSGFALAALARGEREADSSTDASASSVSASSTAPAAAASDAPALGASPPSPPGAAATRGVSASASPASTAHSPRDDVLEHVLPWLTQDFEAGSEEEELVLSRFQLTPTQRAAYASSWRAQWHSHSRALLRSIFDPSVVPPHVAGGTVPLASAAAAEPVCKTCA